MAGGKGKAANGVAVSDGMLDVCAEAMGRYWRGADAAMAAWQAAGVSFLEGLARDYGRATTGVIAAQSPLEIVGLEQELLLARSTAYVALAAGIGDACMGPAGQAAGQEIFHLPD